MIGAGACGGWGVASCRWWGGYIGVSTRCAAHHHWNATHAVVSPTEVVVIFLSFMSTQQFVKLYQGILTLLLLPKISDSII